MPYLQKLRRLWYAILEIPEAICPHFRKPRFVQSLDTDSFAFLVGCVASGRS
jgi:hypothetical protein